MNDIELVSFAAKAADIEQDVRYKNSYYSDSGNPWSPLTDDGDALRLAVALRLYVECNHSYVQTRDGLNIEPYENYGDDPYAATRRAIVRAAAEIGKTK